MATFIGTSASEMITSASVSSTVTAIPPGIATSDAADIFFGNGGNDSIAGGGGNDYLDGGAGDDTMAGETGNDIYVVENLGDTIFEAAGAGTDTAYSYVSDTLDANVENLYLFGTATNGTGNSLNNIIAGNDNPNSLSGLAGNDSLYGSAGNDTLDGGAGNDTLDGGTGDDIMAGGTGNDIYVVDNIDDVVSEGLSAGIDRVNSYVSFTLEANVENLYLFGPATSGTGNNLDNFIDSMVAGNAYTVYGLAGNDTLWGYDANDSLYGGDGNESLSGYEGNDSLDGGTGDDYMVGGTGNDIYFIDTLWDFVSETLLGGIDTVNASINDTLDANVENLKLTGGALNGAGNNLNNVINGNSFNNFLSGLDANDTLNGGAGNDSLDGGTGDDTMAGGTGNDIYFIDTLGDFVSETLLGGIDTVNASISDTLDANVENLKLTGGALNGTGNNLNNVINGNSFNNFLSGLDANDTLNGGAGNDSLDGGTGDDTMAGGTGNDIYFIDTLGDFVSEALLGGIDTVNASISDTLDANVENLKLTGGALNGTGNNLNNVINGNSNANSLSGLAGNDTLNGGAGNDTLDGGTGNDILNGGVGQDRFVFAESDPANRDTISGFSHPDDMIVLRDVLDGVINKVINGLAFIAGVLNAGYYFEGAGFTGNPFFYPEGIYVDTNTGNIFYNPTIFTADDSVQICTVGVATAPTLDNTDFVFSA